MSETIPEAGGIISPATLGQHLRQARESQGRSLEEVSQQLKFSVSQLRALEEGQLNGFSSPVILRGALKNYARLLDLDMDALMAQLDVLIPATVPRSSSPIRATPVEVRNRSRFPVGRALFTVLIAGGLGAAGWWGWQHQQLLQQWWASLRQPAASVPAASGVDLEVNLPAASEGEPLVGAAAPLDVSASGVSASAPLDGGKQLVLLTEEAAWIEVFDGKGTKLYSQLTPPHQTITLSGTPPLKLKVGNAGHVKLEYNGQPIDLQPYVQANVARLTLPQASSE